MTINRDIASDLAKFLDLESSRPLHEQIAAAFEAAIADGRLNHGERLPPQRMLATDLGVAIGTVTRAVETLVTRGLVRAEVGRGTFVWRRPAAAPVARQTIDLSRNVPPPIFEPGDLEARVPEAVRRLVAAGNRGYGDPSGMPEHRSAYAEWIARTGTVLDPAAIMLTVNAQHAVDLGFSDIASHTRKLAVDAATYPGALAAARLRGLEIVPMATDSEGTRPDELERAIRLGARAYYAMPTAHSPLAVHMPLSRREQIAGICIDRGIMVVEDDACVPLRAPGICTLKSLIPDNVYYVTSTAKSFSPLLTSGVIVPPPHRYQATLGILVATVWSVAPLTSAIMTTLFEERADVVLSERLRARTAERLDLAHRLLDVPPASTLSFHIWLPMPLASAERMARISLDRGVRVTPPSATAADKSGAAGVRLCLGGPSDLRELEKALINIAALTRETLEPVV